VAGPCRLKLRAVSGGRDIRKIGCCSNFIQLNHIIIVYHLQFPWQKFQKHNELTNITNNKFKPYTISFKILCTVYRSIIITNMIQNC